MCNSNLVLKLPVLISHPRIEETTTKLIEGLRFKLISFLFGNLKVCCPLPNKHVRSFNCSVSTVYTCPDLSCAASKRC